MDEQRKDRGGTVILNREQKRAALSVPCVPLAFLISPEPRSKQSGMEAFTDSAYFHRYHDLLWTLREPSVVELLNENEREALHTFEQVFASLPWEEFDHKNHFYHLPDDDLSPLVEPGTKLLRLLEARNAKRSWFGRLWSKR